MSTPEVVTALDGYVGTALELRMTSALPIHDATPGELTDSLAEIRCRLDRVEELLSRVIRIRARLQRCLHAAQATLDDAWDEAVTVQRSAPVRRGGDEYTTARERHAEANLATLDLRTATRHAAELAHHADEAVEVIRLAHRGLGDLRHEVLVLLRAVQFESHLER